MYKKITDKPADREHILDSEEWTMLQYFVSIMYWRNPGTKHIIEDRLRNAKGMKDLGLTLKDQLTGNPVTTEKEMEFINRIKADSDFYKFYRSMLPGLTYPEIFKKKESDFAHIFPFTPGLAKLVGDNPIIYRNPGKESIHTDDMIFPLTPLQVLIRNKFSGLIVHSVGRIYIDMLLVMQANQYVSTTDMSYPITLQEEYHKRFTSVDQLRTTLFRYIFQKQPIE